MSYVPALHSTHWKRLSLQAIACAAACLSLPLVSAAATPPVQVAPPITAFAGTGARGNGTTGTATTVALSSPNSVALDGQGNVYILDAGNDQVRKVDTSGNLTTLTLNNLPYSQHNFQAIAFDKASQFLYLSDQLYGSSGGSYGQIYQFAVTQGSDYADLQLTFGAAPASFAPPVCTSQNMGTNASNNLYSGCNPSTVVLGKATGLAVDATGNLYIADGSYYSAVLEVVANGAEVQAIHRYSFDGPVGLAIDSIGNLYVSENSNHDIKKVTPSGALTIFAGGSSAGCANQTDLLGDGCPAADAIFSNGSYGSSSPSALAADTSGNLYIADPNDSLVRVIGSDGYIRAVTGTAICSTATNPHGDGCPALQSIAASPVGLAVDASGSLFIADENAEEIREIPAGPFRFGALPLPSGSSSQSIYFAFNQPETLSAASIKVVTQGAAGLDFQNIGDAATTCTPGAFAAGEFCALHIRFSPRFPGTRQGAALLYNSSGALLATAWLNGTGNASMLGFNPPIASALAATGANFQSPIGVTLDGSGNLYVADTSANTVLQLPPGGSTATSLFPTGTLSAPSDLAIDGAGNLYVADTANNRILELPPSGAASILISSSPLIAGSALNSPRSLASDSSGNLYILDSGNHRVLELSATGSPRLYLTDAAFSPALTSIDSIAIDDSGNLYLADASANQIAAYSASGAATIFLSSTASIDGQRLSGPNHLSIDAVGNLYVSDSGNHRILQITPSGAASDLLSSSTQIASLSLNNPGGIALDGLGDLYAADTGNARILKLDVAASPTLDFGPVPIHTTSAAQSITIRNLGNQSLDSSSPGISLSPLPSPFALLANSPSPCSTPFTLAPGTSCQISIDDQPTSPGTCSGTSCAATLTDNALGAAATQAIYLAANTSPAQAATLSATLSPSAPIPYGQDVTATITASGVSGQPSPTGSISYSLDGSATITAPLSSSGIININLSQALSAGSHTLSYSYGGDSIYAASATATLSFSIAKATPTINWPTPPPIAYGTALTPAQLDATSSIPGSFLYTPSLGAVLSAGAQTLAATFTPTDAANYSAATATVQLTVNKAAPTINWPTPLPISYGTALTAAQLDATSSVPGSFAYTPSLATVLPAGAQTLAAAFTPTDAANYSSASATVQLTVNKAAPTISWPAPSPISYGTALTPAQLDAASSVPGSFLYTPSLGAVLSAGAQTLAAAFTPTDAANYSSASATVQLAVGLASQTISFPSIASPLVYGAAPVQLRATATSSLPIAYSITGPAALSGPSLLITGAGSVTITASQPGDANHAAATPVSRTIAVQPRPLTATVTSTFLVYGQALPTIQGTLIGVLPQDAAKVSAVFSTSATGTSPTGVYPISVALTGPAAPNYTVQLAVTGASAGAGAVTITPAPLAVLVNSATRGYGAPNPVFTGSISGLLNHDAVTATYTSSATATSPVGTYPVNTVLAGAALANYAPAISPGTLTITDATLTITANSASRTYGTPNPAFTGTVTGQQNSDSLTETFTTSATPASNAGTYPIVPSVAGAAAADYAVKASPGTLTVLPAASTTTLSSSSAAIPAGGSLQLTATVASTTTGTPTGSVAFYDGASPLGSATLSAIGASASAASLTVSFPSAGNHSLAANYPGDANFTASSSTLPLQSIAPPAYKLSASPASLALRQGAAGSLVLTATPSGGYQGTVAFSCSGLPANSTCAFSPAAVSLDGSNAPASAHLTIQTISPNGATGALRPGNPHGTALALIFWAPGSILSLLIGWNPIFGWNRRMFGWNRRRIAPALRLLLLFTLMLGLAGCGGKPFQPTPTGTTQVTIAATGANASESIQVSLTVTN